MSTANRPALTNDLFLRALLRQKVDRTPVWMMRQAGRYLPEYRATREKAGSFLKLCMNPELACEVTLQPLARYPLDAAILFSDILTIPHALGLGLQFETGEGPKIERPVRSLADVTKLGVPDPHTELKYVIDAVSLIRRELKGRVPLIGFAGSPWTVGTYAVEGGSSREFSKIKTMMYNEPATLRALLQLLADSTVVYLNAQIAAGAQAVMIFDTWGGVLTPAQYREFSLHYMQYIVDGLTREAEGRRVPVILFTKGAGDRLALMAQTGCDALGVDWTTDLAEARRLVSDTVALQGNLDPNCLYAAPERIREEVARVLASYGQGHGHVFNLGHGIHPAVPPEHAGAMIAAVHELSPQYHV
ncbi:uroporphyrinogen decarboxylase [Steroidobacter sp.]|uniref:uroporphyrinogen decarboxylase n=1 Tax=Steroidobacter sp. TaxID=1978227 RepID=UPI001A38CDCA|nr:uroporphyrinogen decarboxylase [Steroidobacter sp.]MBL8271824.1 uroporphyrinogen decarboxylase [Steroidobacter sp.]